MLVRLVSDMHLEFGKDWASIIPELPEDSRTVLVAAGDIDTGVDACDFLQQASSRFQHVLYVLGNHEFYNNNLYTLANNIREELEDFPNITLLNDDAIVLGETRFIGSTLWTDMNRENPTCMVRIEQAMADYYCIKNEVGEPIRALDTIALHKQARIFIEETLREKHDGPTIVITHHLPSFKSVHPMFQRLPAAAINGGFYSDLDALINEFDIDYWLHGHTHQTWNYELFGTRVRMNPFGYGTADNCENPGFDPEWRIKV